MNEQAVSVEEYAKHTRLSHGQIYARIAAGKIVADRDGIYRIYPKATEEHQIKLAKEKAEKKAAEYQPRDRTTRSSSIRPGRKRKKQFLVKADSDSGESVFLQQLAALRKKGRTHNA